MNDKREVIDNLNELAQLQPSEAAVEQAIKKIRAALNAQLAELPAQPIATVPFWRGFLMRPRNLIATAAAAILIVLATQWLATSSNGNIAFAQVQEQVAKTRSVQYKQLWTEKSADGKSIVQNTSKVEILGDKLKREEFETDSESPFGSYIMIRDLNKQAELILYPKVKAFGLTAAPPSLTDAYVPANEPDRGATAPPVVDGKSSAKGENTFRASPPPAGENPADDSKQSAGASTAVLQSNGSVGDKSWDVSPIQLDSKYSGETELQKKSTEAPGVTAKSATADWTFTANFDSNLKPDPHLDIFALVQHVPTENVKRLPEKLIDGKKAVGFQLDEAKTNKFGTTIWRHTWWVDPSTKLPVRLEVKFRGDDPRSGIDERIISDIVFNAPIEQSLFSLDPPKDYRPLEVVAQEMYPPKASGPANKKTEFVFAEVQDEVAKTKSVQYVETRTDRSGVSTAKTTSKIMVLAPELERKEITRKELILPNRSIVFPLSEEPDGYITITDAKKGKIITLQPDKKAFAIIAGVLSTNNNGTLKSEPIKPDLKADFYAKIREIPGNPIKRIPEQYIDGKKVIGFAFEEKNESQYGTDTFRRTYWVDPQTRLPIRIDATNRSARAGAPETDWVSSGFVFDAPLDSSLFSTDPPAGWTDLAALKPAAADKKTGQGTLRLLPSRPDEPGH